jgi:hypothetical protein
MASPKTNKLARFVKQQPRGLQRPSSRETPGKASGLYLVELRSHHAVTQSTLPRRKLEVTVERAASPDSPRPIRITYRP